MQLFALLADTLIFSLLLYSLAFGELLAPSVCTDILTVFESHTKKLVFALLSAYAVGRNTRHMAKWCHKAAYEAAEHSCAARTSCTESRRDTT